MENPKTKITRAEAAVVISLAAHWCGVSQGSLSRATGVHRPWISNFLNRRFDLMPADIEKLLEVFGLNYRIGEESTCQNQQP